MNLLKLLLIFGIRLATLTCCLMTPLNVKVVSFNDCPFDENKYDHENAVPHSIEVYSIDGITKLIRGNFSIPHEMGPIYLTGRAIEMRRNVPKNTIAIVKNMPCTSMMVRAMANWLAHFKFGPHCEALPGNYSVEALDVSKLAPFMMYIRKRGRYCGIFEITAGSSSKYIACISIVVDFY